MKNARAAAKVLVAVVCMYCIIPVPGVLAQDYLDPSLPIARRVADLLSRMSLDEKIGQMMQVDLSAINGKLPDITTYAMGSILSGGDSDPVTGNSATSWRASYDSVQSYALKTPLKIPIIYGIDAVHGHNNVYGATIFPHNIGMGCTRNAQLIQQEGRATAEEMAATGIRWTFGPMVGVPRNERWGRTYEGFGETPELAQMGAAEIVGLQGDSLSGTTSVLACSKHYLGDGGTLNGVNAGDTQGDETAIRSIHLPGYLTSLQDSVGSIMPSFSSINGVKMHANKYWLTDVLKTELGFRGFIVSDWNGIDQLGSTYTQNVETGINAGIDMAMLPSGYNNFLTSMRSLVSGGNITMSRIDDAVSRILSAKFALGLFEHPYADTTLLPLVGSAEHRAIARQSVRESLVLLKRKDNVLPLPKSSGRILVAGSHADNLGYQCGGWTITWQGGSGNTTVGTTILQGMKNVAPGVQIDYSSTGDFADTNADYSVVVIGEKPYAEGSGDRADLGLPAADVGLIKKMKGYGNPVVVVLISGRPLIIEKILHFSDAIVAAWLPGTEGDGIADVLFGDYAPKGVLSHSWPKSMSQIPINVGDSNYAPLYAYGFGITSFANSPAGSPPILMSGIVTQDGRHIELTFNKKMMIPSGVPVTFSLTKNNAAFPALIGVLPKTGDSTTIILALDTAFARDDTVAVTYVAGGLRSIDGGTLAPFGPVEVYSWVRPAVVALPARIEAEDYADMFGVQLEPTNDVDGTMDVTAIDDGDWLMYTINADAAAYYMLSLRVASATSGGNVSFLFNGVVRGSRGLPVTGSWQSWTTVKQKIAVYAGEQTFTIQVNHGGFNLNWIAFENITGVQEENPAVPLRTSLGQNYPNPFNPTTRIDYGIAREGLVVLKIYNLLGQEVRTLHRGWATPGWYSITVDAADLPSGMYIYRLETQGGSISKKLLLLK